MRNRRRLRSNVPKEVDPVANVDDFAARLLEESKRFFEKAKEDSGAEGKTACLHASLTLAFCAFEAHMNSIAEELSLQSELSILDRSILEEKDYRLIDGQFALAETSKFYRLTDRVEFLFARFSTTPIDKTESWWPKLRSAIQVRNQLTHPKQHSEITQQMVADAIKAIIDCLDALYQAIYSKAYPRGKRGLASTMNF
jgi:hypothetical protein